MNTFSQFLESHEPKGQAISFVKLVTMASRYGALPDTPALNLLANTVQQHSYVVFRGLSFTNLDAETRDALSALEKGSPVPDTFLYPNGAQVVIHATKDASVAEGYASHGVAGLVMMVAVRDHDVIADTTNLDSVLREEDISADDWEYFSKAQELLIRREALFTDTQVVSLRIDHDPITELPEG